MLGSVYLPRQLRTAGLDVTAHDDIYPQTERDPWIFYDRGKNDFVVVTSDGAFMKSFPHMAAIALGQTIVIAFTQNNYKSEIRGNAFLKARQRIEEAIRSHRTGRKRRYFIGVVGMDGSFKIKEESPLPHRKLCDARDWDSYKRYVMKKEYSRLQYEQRSRKSRLANLFFFAYSKCHSYNVMTTWPVLVQPFV